MGGDSRCTEWKKERPGVCSHNGGQMRVWRELKGTRKQLRLGIKLKPLCRGLEALSRVPSKGGAVGGLGGRDFSDQCCDLGRSPRL